MRNISEKNCFNEFDDVSPRKQDPTLQMLLEYEESYLKLLEKHKDVIGFLQDLIDKNRNEQDKFYSDTLFKIKQKLDNDSAIDDEMKQLWLKRLEDNMSKSFDLSRRLLDDFAVKKLDEFRKEAEKMLNNA